MSRRRRAVRRRVRIGICARLDDVQAQRIAEACLCSGDDVVWFDIARFVRGPPLCLGTRGDHNNPDDDDAPTSIPRVDAWLLRQLPGAAAWLGPPDEVLSSSQWQIRARAQLDRHVAAWSAFVALEQRGVPVSSSPARARLADAKPAQLSMLSDAGLPVLPTIITDDDNAAAAFARVHGPCVRKPIVSGEVMHLHDDRRAGLAIVQPLSPGDDVRVVVVDGAVVAAARMPVWRDAHGGVGLDVRTAPGFVDGSRRWQPFVPSTRSSSLALDAFVLSSSVRAAACLGFDFAAIDWKVDASRGRRGCALLEVNRVPVVVDIEHDLGTPIAAAAAAMLARRAHARR